MFPKLVFILCATGLISSQQSLKTQSTLIPENILTKPPSAELKPGQADQASLPLYDILDDIVQRLIHSHQSAAQIVAAGHDSAVVNRVLKMVTRAEFKRRQAPPGLKITARVFATGWRMPIVHKWVSVTTYQPEKNPAPPNLLLSTPE